MNSSVFTEGAKVLAWMETQREKSEQYFTEFAICVGSKVDRSVVKYVLSAAKEALESKNGKWRFNLTWRIEQSLKENVRAGLMVEVSPGRYSLTTMGEQYTKHLIMTNHEAQETIRKLKGKS